MSATPAFAATPSPGVAQILPADASAKKTVKTGGASGSKITSLSLASDDTSDRLIQIWLTRTVAGPTTTSYLLGTVNVPTLSGTTVAAPAVNAFTKAIIPFLATDNDGALYLLLADASDKLEISSTTTVTAAKTVHAAAEAANF